MQQRVTAVSFHAEAQAYGAASIISARGELDFAVTATLAGAMRRALDDAPQIVVLDLSGLSFIDAAGVRAVLSAHGHARARSAEVTIIPGPDAVHRVFALCGADATLPFAHGPATTRAARRHRFARDSADKPRPHTQAA
jgi:anti-sigma B factor antagonist